MRVILDVSEDVRATPSDIAKELDIYWPFSEGFTVDCINEIYSTKNLHVMVSSAKCINDYLQAVSRLAANEKCSLSQRAVLENHYEVEKICFAANLYFRMLELYEEGFNDED